MHSVKGFTPITVFGSMLVAFGGSGCGGPPLPDQGAEQGTEQAETLTTSEAANSASSSLRSSCTGALPSPELAFPTGNELDFFFDAIGVQIYACTAGAQGPAWTFVAPEATLYNSKGRVAGRHFGGPTWEANDGSQVVGARVAGATPDPSAIPWLLLSGASHAGRGKMDEVSFLQRVATVGGLAPHGGCDTTTIGAVARVPYTATYCFAENER
jgi:hypothetical protein